MRLYLDDDSAGRQLIRVLQRAGHDVQIPLDANLHGRPDPVHFAHSIREDRVLLTGNHRDFELLHLLIVQAGGRHSGALAVRKDNTPRDMTPAQIGQAIENLLASGVPIAGCFIVLNHWR